MIIQCAKNRFKPLQKQAKNKLGPDNNPYLDQIITPERANLDQIITSQLVDVFQIKDKIVEVEGIVRENSNEEEIILEP